MISLTLSAPPPPKFDNPPSPSPSSSIKRKLLSPSLQKELHHIQKSPKSLNVGAIKHLLISHVNAGKTREAISTLDVITLPHDDLLSLYSLLLKSCIRTRNFRLGKLIHSKLTESGLRLDSLVLNSLITLYYKSGDWVTAKSIFENMEESMRDLVSWSAMISCFSQNAGMELQAISTFFDMVAIGGIYPNQFCFSAAIQACSNKEHSWIGLVIFGFIIKTGYFGSDVCVGCALIDLFAKGFDDLASAKKVFDKMPEKNSLSWTLMITRFTQLGEVSSGLDLFYNMVSSGFVPDRFTYSSVLSGCSELALLLLGQQVHSMVMKSGLSSDVCVGCSLIDMYAKSAVDGSMVDSRKVFDRIPDHNVMSWTAIITGYAQNGGGDFEAIKLYCRMVEEGVTPNHITFSSLLKACAILLNSKVGEQVHSHAIKFGLASVNCVGNSLISMYGKFGGVEDARKAFDFLFEKNLISYNAIVDGYVKNLKTDEAHELLSQAEDSGVLVDAFTFASLLSGAASVGAVGKGEQIHARSLKAGFWTNQSVCNALISMYSRCGNIEAAFQVFNKLEDKNVISWTAIITGFAKHGFAEKALEMFHEMLDCGVKPNEVTYVAVLSACSHVGLVDKGWSYFNSMSTKHGISPRMEHYACMVDILGRSGSLETAVQFIKSMPFPANALVWRTLLGACRVHGNSELGKYSAKMILKLDPKDPAAHVLLSNLYASRGQWEKVANIRKSMKDRNVVKEAGCSWVEVEKKVHKFYVGDTKHPQAKKIYEELDRLASKIKDMGYIPDTDFVLHEVEEELKEHYLFQHSEKIAVAFGLISTSKPKPIRIFKNLRVCGDCHSAMKYISLASGREIIVRDSNRFHHFKDGTCSCNDYW